MSTNNATSAPPLPQTDTGTSTAGNLRSLATSFLTFTASGDWAKIFVFGWLLETCRRYLFHWRDAITNRFWITATFDANDYSHAWVLFWLSRHPVWKEARSIEVTARSFGIENSANAEDDSNNNAHGPGSNTCHISYIPSLDETYSLWYRGHYMTVRRAELDNGRWNTKETLQISILSFNRRILETLLEEARQAYQDAEKKAISVWTADTGGTWRYSTSRAKRPLTSIILDPGIKEWLLADAREFLNSKKWYFDRGIPFRRGYLLYGPPGTGKTSVIQSIAGELGLNVYIVTLSRAGLDDSQLNELISSLPSRCIALMEDIDVALTSAANLKRELQPDGADSAHVEDAVAHGRAGDNPQGELAKLSQSSARITLSGLLNALDGIGAQEGRILFATTNNYGALDPALCRPGRMDKHIEFKLASRHQAECLYKCFYMPDDPDPAEGGSCVEEAGEKRNGVANHTAEPTEHTPLLRSTTRSLLRRSSDASVPSLEPACHDMSLKHSLSRDEVSALATRFADTIPERELSMASLQGYLMMYKCQPLEAVDDAPQWVAKEKAARKEHKRNAESAS